MYKIINLLNALGAANYYEIARTYFTAKLIIAFAGVDDYGETIRNSRELSKVLHNHRDAVSDVGTENIDSWIELCTELNGSGLDADYRLFFDMFAPNIIEDWDGYLHQFSNMQTGKILMATILLTSYVGEDILEMSSETVRERYNRYSKLYWECGLDLNAFERCWRCVYFSDLADSKIKPKQAVIDAMGVYRDLYLPMTDLLTDYAKLWLQESAISVKTALRGSRRKNRNSKQHEAGKTITDEEMERRLLALSKEIPTDVIRGLFYRKERNDAGIECTYLLQAFICSLTCDNKILIVNPAPDFLLCWKHQGILCEKLCFAVADSTVAMLYAQQFVEWVFIPIDKLSVSKQQYDRILIMARDMPAEAVLSAVQLGTSDAQIISLMPEAALVSRILQTELSEHNYRIRRIISVPTAVTQSEPRKKVLVFADSSWSEDYCQLLIGKCDEDKTVFYTEKYNYPIPHSWLEGSMSIVDMRKKWICKGKAQSTKRAEARIYSWSPEIKLRFTIQKESSGRFAGRMYYRSILRPNQKHRKFGDKLTCVIEKGLRKHSEAEVISALETASLDDRIMSAVTMDILDYYQERKHELSLKTVWYCLRSRLAEEATYSEELAVQMFCEHNQDLAVLCIVSRPDEYEEAMASLFLDDVPVKFWRQLHLLLQTAKNEHYINHNPIQALMPEISSRLNKRQQEVRNQLAKKQFETDEEDRMVNSILTAYGSKEKMFSQDSMWMTGLIRMFAIPDLHQLCALRWMDFEEIWNFGTYQFHVSRYLTDKGIVKPIIDIKREYYRDVPVAPFLAELLLEYKRWIKKRYNLTDDQLALCPIVIEDHGVLIQGISTGLCDIKKAQKKCAVLIESAEISSNELLLPSCDTGDKSTDLNRVYYTVFQTNLRNHLRHICGFTEGELAYMLGQKAPDIFSAHYSDYGHVILQHRMAAKLVRWTGKYLSHNTDNNEPSWNQSVITDAIKKTYTVSATALAHISLIITEMGSSKIAGTHIELSARYGMEGFVTCIGDGE